jgi:hypothetical protein
VAFADLESHSLDYNTAFLNGTLDEDMYIEQPQLYNDRSGKALNLNKAPYGLKQAMVQVTQIRDVATGLRLLCNECCCWWHTI